MFNNSTPSPLTPAIRIEGDIAYIPLRGKYAHLYAIVDAEDAERVSRFKWHASVRGRSCHVHRMYRNGYRVIGVYLHTEIMGTPPDGLVIDHINGDGLDNRKSNLRFATRSQNAGNAKIRRGTKSGFKGVYPSNKKWIARIRIDSDRINLGTFSTPEQAARAYDNAAKEHFGEFAYLNFPEEASR